MKRWFVAALLPSLALAQIHHEVTAERMSAAGGGKRELLRLHVEPGKEITRTAEFITEKFTVQLTVKATYRKGELQLRGVSAKLVPGAAKDRESLAFVGELTGSAAVGERSGVSGWSIPVPAGAGGQSDLGRSSVQLVDAVLRSIEHTFAALGPILPSDAAAPGARWTTSGTLKFPPMVAKGESQWELVARDAHSAKLRVKSHYTAPSTDMGDGIVMTAYSVDVEGEVVVRLDEPLPTNAKLKVRMLTRMEGKGEKAERDETIKLELHP